MTFCLLPFTFCLLAYASGFGASGFGFLVRGVALFFVAVLAFVEVAFVEVARVRLVLLTGASAGSITGAMISETALAASLTRSVTPAAMSAGISRTGSGRIARAACPAAEATAATACVGVAGSGFNSASQRYAVELEALTDA